MDLKNYCDNRKKVKTKTVKEVIEYYYAWKKTQHYKQWKSQFIPDPRTHPHLVALGDHVEAVEKSPIKQNALTDEESAAVSVNII